MTFYLQAAAAEPPAPPAPAPPSAPGERFWASRDAEFIRLDAWGQVDGERRSILRDMHVRLGERSPLRDAVAEIEAGRPAADLFQQGSAAVQQLIAAAAEDARRDPGAWTDLPLSEEALEGQVNARLQERYADAQRTLAAAPEGAFAVETLGMLYGALTEESSLATLGIGAPSGPLRLSTRLAIEAAIGAGVEALTIPQQLDMAERLGLPPPNVLAQIATAAGLQAAVVGTGIAVARGAAYVAGRRQSRDADVPDTALPGEHDARLDAAETQLRDGEAVAVDRIVPRDAQAIGRVSRKIVGVESGGRADARNPNSTATGLGQFIEDTWLRLIEEYRPDLLQGRSRADVLALRGDAALSREMVEAYAAENIEILRTEGFDVTEGNVYLGHFLGGGGMIRALAADPDAPISAVMSAEAIAANRGVKYAGRPIAHWSVRDLRRWAEYKMGAAPDPGDAAAFASSRDYTGAGQVRTARGTRIDVEYEVVDLDDLIFARGDLQNRDRSRPAPSAKVRDRAAGLDPALLLPGPVASHGAPIVGPDDIIESGNGRVMSIAHAAENFPERYEAYRDALRAAGFDVEGVGRPVLVQRRTSELSDEARRRFVVEANEDEIEALSATEQARSDADLLTRDLLGLYDPEAEGLGAATNRDFMRGALRAFGNNALGRLVDRQGRVSGEGVRRVRAALFSRAYDAPDLLERVAEQEGGEIKGLADALTAAAARWAQLRADAAEGAIRPDWDVTSDLVSAVRLVDDARRMARREGMSVQAAMQTLIRQGDMLGGGVSPAAARIATSLFYRGGRARAAEDVAADLLRYADEAGRVGDEAGGLLDEIAPVTPLDALDAIAGRVSDELDELTPPLGDPEADDLQLPPPVLQGFDAADWGAGARGDAAELAAAQGAADLRNVVEGEPFGPVRADLNGRPDEAIDALMEAETGEVPVAMERSDIGPIAFVYGNSAFGLRHIVERHGEDVLRDVPRIVREGQVVGTQRRGTRIILEDGSDPPRRAVIRTDWDDQAKRWVVTAFEFDRGVRQGAEPGVPPVDAPPSPDATGRPRNSDAEGRGQDAVRDALDEARRGALAEGDFAVEWDEQGRPSRMASEALAELDADREFAEAIEFCGAGGRRGA